MNILISAYGSQGDVTPAIAIAEALMQKGHFVKAAVCRGLEYLAIRKQIDFCMYPGDTAKSQFGRLGTGVNAGTLVLKRIKSHMLVQKNFLPSVCKGFDLLISNLVLEPFTHSIAEYCKIPHMQYCLTPMFGGKGRPTAFPFQTAPGWINKIMWGLIGFSNELVMKPYVNKIRKSLGLNGIKNYKQYLETPKTIVCLDNRLAPPDKTWTVNYHYTGYPFLESGNSLPVRVQRFIDSGPPPIYIGFGSMGTKNSARITNIILSSIKSAKVRAIINKGWANLNPDNKIISSANDVLFISEIPHDTLFPFVSGIIHHGGAGTTHTSAKYGKPQFIIPHITDQFYYAHSAFENGLGPKPIPFKKITAEALTKNILELKEKRYYKNAVMFAKVMDANQTRKDIISLIEETAKKRRCNYNFA